MIVGGRPWSLVGRLGAGQHSDVWQARREGPLGELGVLKVPRDEAGREALAREFAVLNGLTIVENQGSRWFGQLLPRPVARDEASGVTAYRWRPGFFTPLSRIVAERPDGVAVAVGLWVWKRLLEQLHWLHQTGMVHGAIDLDHVLVHRHEHGAVLVGFTEAGPAGPERHAALDRQAAAQVVLRLLGAPEGVWLAPQAVPGPVAALLHRDARRGDGEAWAVKEALDAAAQSTLGPGGFAPIGDPR